MAAFYAPGGVQFGGVTLAADKPCLALARFMADSLELAVSNPAGAGGDVTLEVGLQLTGEGCTWSQQKQATSVLFSLPDAPDAIGRPVVKVFQVAGDPTVSDITITRNPGGSATAEWTTNFPTQGGLSYGPVSLDGETPNSVDGGLATNHSVTFLIDADVNYKIVLTNNGMTSPAFYWPSIWPIAGDANRDFTVNILDLIFVRNRLNLLPADNDNIFADVNVDGKINILDLITLRNRINTSWQE